MERSPPPPADEAPVSEYSEVEATREASQPDRFQILMACLVALVALIGAVSSCGLDKSLSDAGSADDAGVTSLINYSDAQTRATLTGLEHYRSFTFYKRYQAQADALRNQLATPHPATETAALKSDLSDAETSVQSYETGITSYLNPSAPTGYDLERDIGDSIALQSAQKDFSFDSYFTTSDKLRAGGQRLLKMPVILALSVVLLAIAQGGQTRLRYLFAASATVIACVSTVLVVLG
jgi:hypothetical protein